MDFTLIRNNNHPLLMNDIMNNTKKECVEVQWAIIPGIFQQCVCCLSGTIEIAHRMNENLSLERFCSC